MSTEDDSLMTALIPLAVFPVLLFLVPTFHTLFGCSCKKSNHKTRMAQQGDSAPQQQQQQQQQQQSNVSLNYVDPNDPNYATMADVPDQILGSTAQQGHDGQSPIIGQQQWQMHQDHVPSPIQPIAQHPVQAQQIGYPTPEQQGTNFQPSAPPHPEALPSPAAFKDINDPMYATMAGLDNDTFDKPQPPTPLPQVPQTRQVVKVRVPGTLPDPLTRAAATAAAGTQMPTAKPKSQPFWKRWGQKNKKAQEQAQTVATQMTQQQHTPQPVGFTQQPNVTNIQRTLPMNVQTPLPPQPPPQQLEFKDTNDPMYATMADVPDNIFSANKKLN